MWKLHLRSVKRWVESRKESVEEKTWYALAGHCTVSLIIIIMIMLLRLVVDHLVCFALRQALITERRSSHSLPGCYLTAPQAEKLRELVQAGRRIQCLHISSARLPMEATFGFMREWHIMVNRNKTCCVGCFRCFA